MLKQISLKALQKAINKAVALDELMPQKLKTLDGKTLEIVLAPLSVHFYICFVGESIELRDTMEANADTVIHSSPIGLIRLSLLPASQARSIFNDDIRISGDIGLGRDVKRLFDSMDIDWEGHLAHFTGDVVAHQIGSVFRKGKSFASQFQSSMQKNITEYIQEEVRLSPSRAELEDFFDDIDTLSLDTERLKARIQLLMENDESD